MATGVDLHLDLGSTEEFYGIPFTVVPRAQPRVPITFGTSGWDFSSESDPGPFPIPLDVHIEGGSAAAPNPASGDRHVVVLQQGTCRLFELYNTVRTAEGFQVSSSAEWDLTVNDTRPAGWTSADAAGLPILPGLLRYDEIAAGEILHAIRLTVPTVSKAWIAPANHAGTIEDLDYPPYGTRVRLQASFDQSGYSSAAQVVLTARKRFGLILADQGSAWYVTGTSDPRFAPLIDELHGTRPVPASAFEVVDTGAAKVCGFTPAGPCE
jgi:hypothetical protein